MLTAKTHKSSIPFRGRVEAAFDVARTALVAMGFEIRDDTASSLRATGPGMHSTHQPALLGVSELRLRATASAISATAILGGAAKMKAFVYLFPPGLSRALLVGANLSGMQVPWLSLLWVAPWAVVAPVCGWAIERRTTKAVDGLLRSMAVAR